MLLSTNRSRRAASGKLSLALAVLLASLWQGSRAAGAQPPVPHVRPDVRARMRAEGHAVVIVSLKPAAGSGAAALSGEDPKPITGAGVARRPIVDASAHVESRLRQAGGATVRYSFRHVPCLIAEVWESAACDLLDDLDVVGNVELDQRGRGALLESAPYIHAPEARALGFDGSGVTAAVLDSGVDSDHPAFAGAIIHEYHFLEQGKDVGPGAEDDHGHGTNVTGIVASRGSASPLGIAPGVKVVAVKVLDSENSGWLSDWAAAVDYVISLRDAQDPIRVDVISMSLVSNSTYGSVCDERMPVFSAACQAATEHGIVLFAASGNDGLTGLLPIPACFSSVLAVGSVLDTQPDRISSFTNRGPLLDLLAPGQPITSAGLGGGKSTLSGTSQATPHAAAVACLLREADPALTPAAIKRILVETGRPLRDSQTDLVFPILDALAAVEDALVPRFVRADCDASGKLELTDAVFLLVFLFQGGAPPSCAEACDANDDGSLNLTDALFSLGYQFLGGPAPPPPFGACGPDPQEPQGSALGCEGYTCR